jgi:hypothetical protein
MFREEAVLKARQMYEQGSMPSDILRFFAQGDNNAQVPELMQLLRKAFSLSYEDTQCIGGWWHDGSGELNDDQLNTFLVKAIRTAAR